MVCACADVLTFRSAVSWTGGKKPIKSRANRRSPQATRWSEKRNGSSIKPSFVVSYLPCRLNFGALQVKGSLRTCWMPEQRGYAWHRPILRQVRMYRIYTLHRSLRVIRSRANHCLLALKKMCTVTRVCVPKLRSFLSIKLLQQQRRIFLRRHDLKRRLC